MGRARVAPLEVTAHVAAPPQAVWDVLKQQRRMKAWSPETWHQWFYPHQLSHGQISVNLNRRGWFVWPTFSRYVDVARPHRLAFHVYGPAARWGYRLDAEGNGTRITLRRDLKNGRPSWATIVLATLALGGPASHDVELVAGMERTLERIRAEVEASVHA